MTINVERNDNENRSEMITDVGNATKMLKNKMVIIIGTTMSRKMAMITAGVRFFFFEAMSQCRNSQATLLGPFNKHIVFTSIDFRVLIWNGDRGFF